MPLFDVFCDAHGRQEVSSKEPSGLHCPVCERKVQRLWSAPATFRVDFRSGWDVGAGQYFYAKRDRENWISTSNSRRIMD